MFKQSYTMDTKRCLLYPALINCLCKKIKQHGPPELSIGIIESSKCIGYFKKKKSCKALNISRIFIFLFYIFIIILSDSPFASLSNPSLISSKEMVSPCSLSTGRRPCLNRSINLGISRFGTQLPT